MPREILEALERSQPYQSPSGPESNLTYWIHELARTDRHRTPHVGLGRVDEHHIKIAVPSGITVEFDESVDAYRHIEGELTIARFTTSKPLTPRQIKADLRGVVIAPETQAWADFKLGGKSQTLWDRMVYAELFTRNHLENMALMGGAVPPDGFKTFDPTKLVRAEMRPGGKYEDQWPILHSFPLPAPPLAICAIAFRGSILYNSKEIEQI